MIEPWFLTNFIIIIAQNGLISVSNHKSKHTKYHRIISNEILISIPKGSWESKDTLRSYPRQILQRKKRSYNNIRLFKISFRRDTTWVEFRHLSQFFFLSNFLKDQILVRWEAGQKQKVTLLPLCAQTANPFTLGSSCKPAQQSLSIKRVINQKLNKCTILGICQCYPLNELLMQWGMAFQIPIKPILMGIWKLVLVSRWRIGNLPEPNILH